MADPSHVRAQFPEKLAFLFDQGYRYKVALSGRGAAKSWSFARALLLQGWDPSKYGWKDRTALRIVCARETMDSIEVSVHPLLEQQIAALGLGGFYDVQKKTIIGKNGTSFIFRGLKHDVDAMKSLEGADVAWVEEGQSVSKSSWDALVPSVRKPQSQIWCSYNPKLASDCTHVRFTVNPPTGAKVVKLSWRDNPWFPEVLEVERQDMLLRDPLGYQNVWEGECLTAVDGAIFATEMKKCTAEGRICSVPYNPTRPVDTAWDLGFDDNTAIFFTQSYDGWWNFIDYLDGSGLTIADYIIKLQNRGYMYGTHFLPHDSVDTIIHKNLAGGDRQMSIEQLLRKAYPSSVRVVPKMLISDQLNAARTIFGRCRFDAEKCADGLQSLRHYQWPPLSAQGVGQRKPLHNWASHGSSAFCYAAVAIKSHPATKAPAKQQRHQQRPQNAWV